MVRFSSAGYSGQVSHSGAYRDCASLMQKSSGLVSRSQIRDAITTISERLAATMLLIGGVQIADKPIYKSRVPRHRLGGYAASGRFGVTYARGR